MTHKAGTTGPIGSAHSGRALGDGIDSLRQALNPFGASAAGVVLYYQAPAGGPGYD
jgi:hypothetical protein